MNTIKNTVRTLIFAFIGAIFAGWFVNRLVYTMEDHPFMIGGDTADAFVASITSNPIWLAPEYMQTFWYAAIIAFILIFVVSTTQSEKRRNKEVQGKEFGGARWADKKEISAFSAKNFEDNFILSENAGISIPRIERKSGLAQKLPAPFCNLFTPKGPQDRNKHILIIGGSGAGKGYNVIGPNILQAKYSFLLTDPKGDTLRKYGSFLLEEGYKVKVVNVKDPASFVHSFHYNPIHYITSQASIMSLVSIIIENTKGQGEKSGEDFFIKAERCIYMCLIAYQYYAFADNPAEQTIPKMLDLLSLAEASEQDETKKSALDFVMEDYKEELVEKYGSEEEAQKGEEWFVLTQYDGFKKAAGETAKSILISCFVRLAPFAIGSLREMFSSDELELEKVGEEKTAFFLIMSDTDKTFNFILAMLLYQFFDINTAVADKNPDSHCTIPIECYLDELANIGTIPDLDIKAATLRSRWINLCLFIQNMAQLEKNYTKEGARVIAGNCDTLLFLGRSDQETNETISKRLGNETIEYKTFSDSRKSGRSTTTNLREHPLMSAEDLGSNPEKFADNECLVLINNFHPFKDRKFSPPTHPNAGKFAKSGSLDVETYVAKYRAKKHREKEEEELAQERWAQEMFEQYVSAFQGIKQVIFA